MMLLYDGTVVNSTREINDHIRNIRSELLNEKYLVEQELRRAELKIEELNTAIDILQKRLIKDKHR